MEFCGIGFLQLRDFFGMRSIRHQSTIDLLIPSKSTARYREIEP
jgi:hypothetical protein